MTVPATPRRAGPFTGNGVTTSFPFTFKVFSEDDVRVVRAADGLETTLVVDSDYSVTLNSDQDASPGGSITYPLTGDPLPSDETLTIAGALENTQELDLPGGGAFNPRALEDALDRIVIQVQQIDEVADRALTLPVSAASGVSTQLPVPAANNVIGWDETAQALVNLDPASLATVVVAGTSYTDVFSGTGAQTQFVLTANPGSVNALDVAISGVSQVNGVDFNVSGTTLTFTSAPPAGADNIAVRYVAALPVGTANAQDVTYLPDGGGAAATTVEIKLHELRSSSDYPSWGSRCFGAGGGDIFPASGFVGVENTAFGWNVLSSNTSGFANCGFGVDILSANTTGFFNCAFGVKTLWKNTTGGGNTAFGAYAMYENKTGNANTSFGEDSNRYVDGGNENVAVGTQSLYNNVTGSNNTAVGTYAARNATNPPDDGAGTGPSPTFITALGSYALYTATGSMNTAAGFEAGYLTTGSGNSYLGAAAGRAITSGANNVFVGADSGTTGQSSSATDSVVLGRGAYSTGNNAISIGAGVSAGTNQVVIGNASHTGVFVYGNFNPQTDRAQDVGGAAARWRNLFIDRVTLTPLTVAALPTPSAGLTGARAFVTNATATTFASVVAGGGANAVPVYCDGAAWRIG